MRLLHAVLLAGQAITFASGQKWTLHKSCTTDGSLQSALIKAMQDVKDKTADIVESLEASKRDSRGKVKKAAEFLLGSNDYKARVDEAIEYLSRFAALEGPIGEPDPSNLLGDSFMEHEDWKKLGRWPETDEKDFDSMMHWKDFIIYCTPDISAEELDLAGVYYHDNAREQYLAQDNPLITMKEEGDTGQWKNPHTKLLGLTRMDDGSDLDSKTLEPKGERRAIPQTITLNPMWLRDIKENDYDQITDKRIETVTMKSALSKFREQGITPVDALMGLEGTLRHECFHLMTLGRLKDRESGDAYGWANCITHKDLTDPDTLAYLVMVVYLADKEGFTFTEDGRVKK